MSKNSIFTTFIVATILIVMLFVPEIPQDLAYHNFADQRAMLGVPNLLNVLSNIIFLVVGISGVVYLLKKPTVGLITELYSAYLIFFIGIFFVGIGSSYFHIAPSNQTLIWDRLPMTIAFMAFFSIILAEFVSLKLGKWLLLPLLVVGIFSVWYWNYTEQLGAGDLRLYALVQFLPMLLIPIILVVYPSKFTHKNLFWFFLAFYVLAKILEEFDEGFYQVLSIVSGHSLKHVAASLGCGVFLYQIKKRQLSN